MEKSTFTFWELINKWTIVIPQVQRDYAYGRDDAKAVAVSTGILKSIHDALMVTMRVCPMVVCHRHDFNFG